ncbi:hypothetical protein HDU93_006574, partial [Gonapodya sp. JEL0774]
IVSPTDSIFALYVITSFFGQLHGVNISVIFFYYEYMRIYRPKSRSSVGGNSGSQSSQSRAKTSSFISSARPSIRPGTGDTKMPGQKTSETPKVDKSAAV